MEELATLARPYANAVFDLAIEANNFETWSNHLNFLATLVEDPTMAEVIANPQVDKKTLIQILLNISESYLSNDAKNLLKIIVDNNRLPVIPSLVLQYEALRRQYQGYIKVDIASPYPLNPEQQEEIETALQKRFGKAVDISNRIDKSLLGGCLIRTANEVIDISIKGYLQQLTAELRR